MRLKKIENIYDTYKNTEIYINAVLKSTNVHNNYRFYQAHNNKGECVVFKTRISDDLHLTDIMLESVTIYLHQKNNGSFQIKFTLV